MKNPTIINFTRGEIKSGLHKLNDGCQTLFKRMYARVGDDVPIDEVVDGMPSDNLEWALTQVQNSLKNPKLLRLDTSGKHLCKEETKDEVVPNGSSTDKP